MKNGDSDGSSNDTLGTLLDEYLDRLRRGERPTISEYVERHPDLAAEIRELFSALPLLEDLGSEDDGVEAPLRQLGEFRKIAFRAPAVAATSRQAL